MAGLSARGPRRAEAGNVGVNDVRVGFFDALVIKLELVDLADAIVVNQYIAFLCQPQHDGHTLLGLEIDRERALGAVDDHGMRGVVTLVLAQPSAPAADAGRLNLDHIGAVARQVHAAIGAGYTLRQIENLYALEGQIVLGHRIHFIVLSLVTSHQSLRRRYPSAWRARCPHAFRTS